MILAPCIRKSIERRYLCTAAHRKSVAKVSRRQNVMYERRMKRSPPWPPSALPVQPGEMVTSQIFAEESAVACPSRMALVRDARHCVPNAQIALITDCSLVLSVPLYVPI